MDERLKELDEILTQVQLLVSRAKMIINTFLFPPKGDGNERQGATQ